jgi:Phosphotransferase enzyme family
VSVTRPPVPLDDALPAMPRMLDVDVMAPVLQRSLGGGRSIDSVTIRYLRYKQGRSLLVRYEVVVDGLTHGVVALAEPNGKLAQRAELPANLALAAKAEDRAPARSPLAYEEHPGILVQWTPVDIALPAMAEPPERLREILEEAGVRTRVHGELPQLVHYKPNRRAVLRYGEHFVKIYADDRAYERAVAGMLAANALPMRSARCDAAIPALRLTAQSLVEGTPPAGPVEAAPAAGEFLAMLHATPNETVRVTPPAHRFESATASVQLLASIDPRLEQRLGALLRRLEERMPDEPLVLSHGDFHARQMLELPGDYGVIDFDASCRAPAALDMATYISSLVRGLDDLPAGMAALDVLGEAYGRHPAGVPWYLTCVLLRRASIPFRVFREGWPDQVEERVRCAERALAS